MSIPQTGPIPCQCDIASTDHTAGACEHAAHAVYVRPVQGQRIGELIALCHDCHVTGDRHVRDIR